MAPRLDELAKTFDQILLDRDVDDDTLERACEEARELHVASLSVAPANVARAAACLRGCDVKVAGVVGSATAGRGGKAAAADLCVVAGAAEVEVAIDVEGMLSGEFRLVRDELAAIVRAVRMRAANLGRGAMIVKAVVDAPRLDDKRKKLACKILEDVGCDFAQTTIGDGSGDATVHDVELLRDTLSEDVGVKAAGGIETAEDFYAMLNAGAARVGTAAASRILRDSSRLLGVP